MDNSDNSMELNRFLLSGELLYAERQIALRGKKIDWVDLCFKAHPLSNASSQRGRGVHSIDRMLHGESWGS